MINCCFEGVESGLASEAGDRVTRVAPRPAVGHDSYRLRMNRPTSDALSLTLPARCKSRARLRRPRRPTGWEVWFLALTTWSVIFAVADALGGSAIGAVWQASVAGIYWRSYWRARTGRPPYLQPAALAYIIASWIPVVIILSL